MWKILAFKSYFIICKAHSVSSQSKYGDIKIYCISGQCSLQINQLN